MGERLRQEQWEAVRTMKLRNEMLRMAECLGEEMAGGEEEFVSLQLTTVTSSCFVGQVKKRVLLEIRADRGVAGIKFPMVPRTAAASDGCW